MGLITKAHKISTDGDAFTTTYMWKYKRMLGLSICAEIGIDNKPPSFYI